MRSLIIATKNIGKFDEIKDELAHSFDRFYSLADFDDQFDVVEDGQTYAENAMKKARKIGNRYGIDTLSDDSGLEVTALGGEPGLHSHRYSPLANANDADRRAFLLRNLREHTRPWRARFVCTIAIATPEMRAFDPRLEYATGECPGEIIPEERGSNGFGYDPIFLIKELDKTMAELSTQEKNCYSHRSRALHNAVSILIRMINE